jgi:hypothetical protein
MKSKNHSTKQSDGVKLWTVADTWTVAGVLIAVLLTLANAV